MIPDSHQQMKYSIKANTLALAGLDVLEQPRKVIEQVASAGYSGIELKTGADGFDQDAVREMIQICKSLGIKLISVDVFWSSADTTSVPLRITPRCCRSLSISNNSISDRQKSKERAFSFL